MRPAPTCVDRGRARVGNERSSWRAGGAAVVVALLVGSATAAAGDSTVPGPVGGDLLGRRDTVVLGKPGTPRPPANLTAGGWLVADLNTGEVLAAHDAHGRFPPASTLKTLTALTLIPRLNPGRIVTATTTDVAVDGSKVGLVPGHPYRVYQLFQALLVVSGNDAANVLAAAGGGSDRTVALMNAAAAKLQARDTTARTVSGLDAAGQVSSAYDLALIGRAAMRLTPFRRYVAVRRSYIPAPGGRRIEIGSHNRLLWNYPGAIGIKNGYTVAAGAAFIGAATRGGRTLEVTLLHASPRVWHEAAALLDWGFATADRLTPVGQLVDPLVTGGPTAAPLDAGRGPGGLASSPGAVGLPPERAPAGPGRAPWLVAVAALLVGAGALVRWFRPPRTR